MATGCDHYWLARRGGRCRDCGTVFPGGLKAPVLDTPAPTEARECEGADEENDSHCDVCGKVEAYAKTSDYAECKSCEENRRERSAERASESALSDYYGSSTPQTLDELHMAAWRQKEGR